MQGSLVVITGPAPRRRHHVQAGTFGTAFHPVMGGRRGCTQRGVVRGWQGIMQVWIVGVGSVMRRRGLRVVAVVHPVVHRQVAIRGVPIGTMHHAGRQGPRWGCKCGFNLGNFGKTRLEDQLKQQQQSTLDDVLKGSEERSTWSKPKPKTRKRKKQRPTTTFRRRPPRR